MTVDFDMDFDKQRGATFSNSTFLDGPDAGDLRSYRANLLFDFFRRSRIEDITRGDVQETQTAVGDHRAGDQGGPVVGRLVARSTDKGNRDTDEGRDARYRIGTMMPSVGLKGNTVGLFSHTIGPARQGLFDRNDQEQA